MSNANDSVTKSTLYICIGVSLLVGFLGGIVYSVYKGPVSGAPSVQQQQQGSTLQAIASLEAETSRNPDNVEAWTQLGHAYFDSDQYGKAIFAYNKSLELLPGNLNVMTDLGVMYRRNGNPEMALQTFDKVLSINPRHEQARFNKGVVQLYDFNDTKAAIESWSELVRVNPLSKTPAGGLVSDLVKDLEAKVQGQ